MRENWKETLDVSGLKISVNGLPALSSYSFQSEDRFPFKTLIIQEFLKPGCLASIILYASYEHDIKKFDEYGVTPHVINFRHRFF